MTWLALAAPAGCASSTANPGGRSAFRVDAAHPSWQAALLDERHGPATTLWVAGPQATVRIE